MTATSSGSSTARQRLAVEMADLVGQWLESLRAEQRAVATWPFPSGDERELWFYTPTDHGGLAMSALTASQQQQVMRLLSAGLSEAGYVTASIVMAQENLLDRTEGWGVRFGRERGRDPGLYYLSVFGEPGSDAWAWRFGGHHISLHYTVLGGEVVSTTPCFFGADPATSPLLGPHLHRPLAGVEDLARELVHSLSPDQRSQAILSPIAPSDLVTGNRSVLSDGDRMLPLTAIWRGRLEAELDELMAAAQTTAESQSGITDDDYASTAFTSKPKGLSMAACSTDQHEIMRALLSTYLDRIPPELAADEHAKFTGTGIDSLSLAWAGSVEAGQPHYYRVQGSELLVEYDNTQRDVNHVHSVWRDLRGDFGRSSLTGDPLAEHYTRDH